MDTPRAREQSPPARIETGQEPQTPPPPAAAVADETDPQKLWARICDSAPGPASRALLGSLSLRSCEAGRAVLAAASPEDVSYAKSKSEQIGKLMRECLGRPVRIEIVSDEAQQTRRAPAVVDNSVYENPLVRQAIELFDAQVIAVEEMKQPTPSRPEPQQGD